MPPRRRTSTRGNLRRLTGYPGYPGHSLKVGTKDKSSVQAVQERLNEMGCGPIPFSGAFDKQTRAAVDLFKPARWMVKVNLLRLTGWSVHSRGLRYSELPPLNCRRVYLTIGESQSEYCGFTSGRDGRTTGFKPRSAS